MIHCDAPQGSDEWLEARRGVITGSRFRDARSKLKSGDPSKAALAYATDIARERLGGTAPSKFQTYAMRQGQEQEPIAAARYEQITGNLVDECGFFMTEDGMFGLSPDRLIDDDGVLEIKTIFSSDTLFTAVVQEDVSDYLDQCLGYLWLLGREWVDLALWVPDMGRLIIRRIARDEGAIEALEEDMVAFSRIVQQHEDALRDALDASRKDLIMEDNKQAEAEEKRRRILEEAAKPAVTRALESIEQGAPGKPVAPIPVAHVVSGTVHTVETGDAADNAPTLNLSAINARLAPLSISGAGLAEFDIEPLATEKNSKLYSEAQFSNLLCELVDHINRVTAKARREQLEAA